MKKIFTLLLLLCSYTLFSQTIYYVKTTGNDANSGTSWATAFKTLQKAINTISTGEIRVAAGTYYPDEGPGQTDNNRGSYFNLKNGVAIYGGFAGTDTALSQRNWKTNPTSLSGEIQRDGDSTNNSLHIVRSNSVDRTAVLDGFFITRGNANGAGQDYRGGGIYNNSSFPTINNCVFMRNTAGSGYEGAGAAMFNISAAPLINNCSFIENTCNGGGSVISSGGGAINNNGSSPQIFNCVFSGNKGSEGGAILNWSSNPLLVNCSFFQNQAISEYGGGIFNTESSPTIINCNFYANLGWGGGGICNITHSAPVITNCIFWANTRQIFNEYYGEPVVSYSIVQGGYDGIGNINLDPLFTDPANGNFHLQICSPAIDVGNNSVYSITSDLGGNPRNVNGKLDIGAYEFQQAATGAIIYVKQNATGSNNGTSWTNAFTRLQDALAAAGCGGQVWVAKGTFYPDETAAANSNDRAASFNLTNRTKIYGGFAGTETSLDQRALGLNATILSGEIQQDDNPANNSYYVVKADHVNSTPVLDGFTITGGYANDRGGGLYNFFSGAIINNCSFTGNSAPTGGGIYNFNSSPQFTNCHVSANTAQNSGGGMYNEGSGPLITNCSFAGNTVTGSQLGGGIYNNNSFPRIANSILWQNTPLQIAGNAATVSYSIVQGTGIYPGTGNLNLDPLFAGSSVGDFHLQACSPAVDAGNSASVVATTDLDGQVRIYGSKVDMGAYEFQGRIYVNERATGSNTGSSWQNAFTKLQDALARSQFCNVPLEIWVASGIYYPDQGSGITNDDRSASFHLHNNIHILGGFKGNELSVDQRDPHANISILSGEIQEDDDTSNNALHVVSADSVDNSAMLNGFMIVRGNANGSVAPDNQGGGIRLSSSTPGIYYCRIAGNAAAIHGGGIYNEKSSPTIGMSSFVGNTAHYGGGICNVNASSPMIIRCSFESNSAFNGGGIYNRLSSPNVSNSMFYINNATNGGAAYNEYASPNFSNCSLTENTAVVGGAMSNGNAVPVIVNSILWNDHPGEIHNAEKSAVITYSIVKGGYPGAGNLVADPQFVRVSLADLHLRGCSPAIDAGDSSLYPGPLDLDGNSRVRYSRVDMGAYEFEPGGPGGIVYVNRNATGNNNGTSWQNAYTSLQDALANTGSCKSTEIWVTADTYYPDEGTGLANNDRNLSFLLKNNVTLLGGFNGTESPEEPMPLTRNKTTLSGEIQQDGDSTNNAYHVMQAHNINETAMMQDFIITGGNASAAAPHNLGGGIYIDSSMPDIRQTFITRNYAASGGGGVYSFYSSPSISNCRISGNSSGDNGGGIYNVRSSGRIVNCMITENRAGSGAGIFNYTSSTSVINAAFFRNQAPYGGGIYNYSNSSAPVVNCSFYGNGTSQYGGGIYNGNSSPAITNCIFWSNSSHIYNSAGSNPSVSYSLIQGGYPGSNILNVDPMFIGADTGNLRLPSNSPAVDAGNNAVVTTAHDLGGHTRIFNNRVDLGAFEYSPGISHPPQFLTLMCPADFSVFSDPETCNVLVDFTGEHAATTTGGSGPVTISYEPASGSSLPVGATLVTVTATDNSQMLVSGKFWVSVIDNTPPVIRSLRTNPTVLYPPNHKMRDIDLAYTATDNCGTITTSISVTSNEPQYGTGSGDTGPDWQLINDHKLKLRAERSGNGSDRVYTIILTAIDASGNTDTDTTMVIVPHDNRSPVTMSQPESNKPASNKEVSSLFVSAVPNPSSEGFTLYTQSPSALPLSIRVMDGAGRIVESRKGVVANGTLYFGTTYRPGVYYVQVMQGDVMQTIKLVKQNW